MLKENQHGYCPKCNMDFDDESIWETFYNQEKGKGVSEEEASVEADRLASYYGATKTKGKFGKKIGLYSLETDRTYAYKCPECGHEWPRRY